MMINVKMMIVFVDETDMHGEIRLFEYIVRKLSQLGIAGATVQLGVMGFGSHRRVHQRRLFGISDDRPVTITAIDREEMIREVLPEIQPLVREGLIVILDVAATMPIGRPATPQAGTAGGGDPQ